MFPEELMKVISKHKSNNQNHIRSIYENLCEIIKSLKGVQNNIASELFEINKSDDMTDSSELQSDIDVLKEQIAYIKSFTSDNSITEKVTETVNNYTEKFSNEITSPIFTKRVFVHLTSDDLCPFCNVKPIKHYVYYQRIVDNKIKNDSVIWHRCPACNKLLVIDYEIEDFDFKNTNISVNKDKYNEILPINIYTLIVLSNTLKCSSNHDTKDIIAKLPVLNEYGQITYIDVNASYCPICNRYTILKEDFNAIAGIVTCKVIDETVSYENNNNTDIEIDNKQSILAQYGYNVQTKKDLSEQQRHIILSSIIEAQIMSRREVIDHITTLIERGSKIPNWKYATQKWKDDRKFVSDYQSDCLPEIVFNNIILKYRKSQ